jgi:hypothetical protein
MGLGVEVDVPASGYGYRVEGDATAWIEQEVAFFDSAPRFLISIFWEDRPGVLARTLRVINDGIWLPDDTGDSLPADNGRQIEFSIDDSLSSSIGDAFVLALVVSLVNKTESMDTSDQMRARIALQSALDSALRDMADASRLPPSVKVFPFRALPRRLFFGRQLSEYRFGVNISPRQASYEALGALAASFARRMGAQGIPIAYLYFPDDLEANQDICWLRIGVGAPAQPVESLMLDLVVDRLAEEYHCIYKVYDPGLPGRSMKERFRHINDYRLTNNDEGSSPLQPTIEPGKQEDSDGQADFVFAEGPAEAGYVAEMLSGETRKQLMGGTMTVLAGHTVCCWVVQRGAGEQLAEHIRQCNSHRPGSENTRVFYEPLPSDLLTVTRSGDSYWLAWKCADKPGVLHKVVDLLLNFVADSCGGSASDVDVKYAISRVVAEGTICIGKLNFLIANEAVAGSFADSSWRLERQIVKLLKAETRHAMARDRRWEKPIAAIDNSEPGQEPWVSLLITPPRSRAARAGDVFDGINEKPTGPIRKALIMVLLVAAAWIPSAAQTFVAGSLFWARASAAVAAVVTLSVIAWLIFPAILSLLRVARTLASYAWWSLSDITPWLSHTIRQSNRCG